MKRFLGIFLAIALISTIGFVTFADRNISSNELPNEAKAFINKHYAGTTIYECEIDDMEYNVELSNGVDLEFNRNGKLVKIEADHGVIAQSVLKTILPAKALQYLTAQGLADKVDDVEFRRNSIVVDINNSNDHEIRFNLDGSLKGHR